MTERTDDKPRAIKLALMAEARKATGRRAELGNGRKPKATKKRAKDGKTLYPHSENISTVVIFRTTLKPLIIIIMAHRIRLQPLFDGHKAWGEEKTDVKFGILAIIP
ncbi:MAG: hypothetical protein ACI3Y5_01570 [Prevotella sp.]